MGIKYIVIAQLPRHKEMNLDQETNHYKFVITQDGTLRKYEDLSKYAILGLALSGHPEAAVALRSLKMSFRESSCRGSGGS